MAASACKQGGGGQVTTSALSSPICQCHPPLLFDWKNSVTRVSTAPTVRSVQDTTNADYTKEAEGWVETAGKPAPSPSHSCLIGSTPCVTRHSCQRHNTRTHIHTRTCACRPTSPSRTCVIGSTVCVTRPSCQRHPGWGPQRTSPAHEPAGGGVSRGSGCLSAEASGCASVDQRVVALHTGGHTGGCVWVAMDPHGWPHGWILASKVFLSQLECNTMHDTVKHKHHHPLLAAHWGRGDTWFPEPRHNSIA
eukprot:1158721-Pelagomonas_calceolata.AAC.5